MAYNEIQKDAAERKAAQLNACGYGCCVIGKFACPGVGKIVDAGNGNIKFKCGRSKGEFVTKTNARACSKKGQKGVHNLHLVN